MASPTEGAPGDVASKVDPEHLPLSGAVLEVGAQEDGRMRVTFRNLASIYFLDEDSLSRPELLIALERSEKSGEVLHLTYALIGKKLNGFVSVLGIGGSSDAKSKH